MMIVAIEGTLSDVVFVVYPCCCAVSVCVHTPMFRLILSFFVYIISYIVCACVLSSTS